MKFERAAFSVRHLWSSPFVRWQGRLADRLDALESLELGTQQGEAVALAAEIRVVAHRRQGALQDLARASLVRMGLGQFDIPGAPSQDGDKVLEALHMRTCDLVRRAVLLLCALQKARC